ncbi:MAG: hypothetical protein A4E66_00010 [Syntrophus sp. PtaB.Bin001]|nr:MAG: hypothetical protein A4E66_00010 [Syntrophus sp. PtaB.Bin001]
MSWRDIWQKGSFRGAEFCWMQSSSSVGRKTARHDYPLRDETYVEDLGKRPREFTLECFVIGENYTDKRDALIEALEKEGPGTLIHPTMGMMLVCLNGDVRITESTSEGGMCRFSIPFVLAEEKKLYPSAAVDTVAVVDAQADKVIAAVVEDFGNVCSIDELPQYAIDDGIGMIGSLCEDINRLASSFPTNVETPAFLKDLGTLKNSISTLIGKPGSLAQAIASQFNKLRDVALAPLDLYDYADLQAEGISSRYDSVVNLPQTLFDAYADRFDFGTDSGSESVPKTTPSRIQQAENRDAINALVRRTAIAEAARTSSTIEFASYDEAISVQKRLTEAIDNELLEASDSVYAVLADLRAAVVNDIRTRGADLSRIINYTPSRTEPALIIAHRLYGDATRADEIVARNRIRHPLFVPGGVALEVLSD